MYNKFTILKNTNNNIHFIQVSKSDVLWLNFMIKISNETQICSE